MFSGASKEKKVSMRGRSSANERSHVIEAAKQEREARARTRTQEKSAVAIQSLFRGHRARLTTATGPTQDALKKIGDLQKLDTIMTFAKKPLVCPPTEIVVAIMRTAVLQRRVRLWSRVHYEYIAGRSPTA
jgi:hypothetical protein